MAGQGKVGEEEVFDGWRGKLNKSVAEVIEDISTLKSTADCPRVKLKYQSKNQWSTFQFTHVVAPHGRCCKVIRPSLADEEPMKGVVLFANTTFEYRIFLTDQHSASLFYQRKFNIIGQPLITSFTGRKFIIAKMKEERSFEGNKNLKCREYDWVGQFGEVILLVTFHINSLM